MLTEIHEKVRTVLGGKLLAGATPAARLAEIESEIVRIEGVPDAERKRFTGGLVEGCKLQLESATLAAMSGQPGAGDRVTAKKAEMGALGERIADLRAAAGAARAQIAAEKREAARRAAEVLPRFLAEKRAACLRIDNEVTVRFKDVAELLKARAVVAADMIDAVGPEAARSFSFAAFASRFRTTICRHFHFDFTPGAPHNSTNNLLGLMPDFAGAAYWQDIDAVDRDLFDDLCPYFVSEPEAVEAQNRLAARNTPTTVVRLADVFCVVRMDCAFADRDAAIAAAAALATRGLRRAVIPANAGFVLVDERIGAGLAA